MFGTAILAWNFLGRRFRAFLTEISFRTHANLNLNRGELEKWSVMICDTDGWHCGYVELEVSVLWNQTRSFISVREFVDGYQRPPSHRGTGPPEEATSGIYVWTVGGTHL